VLSKRHYEAIAKIINETTVVVRVPAQHPDLDVLHIDMLYQDILIERLASYFFEDNPRFDVDQFKATCLTSELLC